MSLIITFMFEPAKLQMNWASASGARNLRRSAAASATALIARLRARSPAAGRRPPGTRPVPREEPVGAHAGEDTRRRPGRQGCAQASGGACTPRPRSTTTRLRAGGGSGARRGRHLGE